MTSLYVNASDDADAQLIVDREGCGTDEVRLTLANNDVGDVASMWVNPRDLRDLVNRLGDLG